MVEAVEARADGWHDCTVEVAEFQICCVAAGQFDRSFNLGSFAPPLSTAPARRVNVLPLLVPSGCSARYVIGTVQVNTCQYNSE